VQIRAVAREAGERTKIAVESRDKEVDPVGACVGMKGMRVQSIIRELRGEKIDIIPYNEDTLTFAQKSLSPAKVTRVQVVDVEEKRLEVIVEDTQLSLAIGKKGQNVRLASKLIGWNIDIKSEEEKRREIEDQMTALTSPGTPLTELAGVGPKTVEKLEAHGVTSIEKLADMTPEQLVEIPGIGEKMVEKIRQSVGTYFEELEARQAAEAVAAAEAEAIAAAAPPAVEEAPVESVPAEEESAAAVETTDEAVVEEPSVDDEETTEIAAVVDEPAAASEEKSEGADSAATESTEKPEVSPDAHAPGGNEEENPENSDKKE
jgi:N utilization substance protein A